MPKQTIEITHGVRIVIADANNRAGERLFAADRMASDYVAVFENHAALANSPKLSFAAFA